MSDSVQPYGGPPGSPVPGILQARTLEWVAISFSNAWKWKVKVKPLSRVRLLAAPWTAAYQAPPSMGFSRQEYWSGVQSTQGKILIYWMSKFVLQCVLVATGCSLFLNLNTFLLSNVFLGVCLHMEYSFSNLTITFTTVAHIIVR